MDLSADVVRYLEHCCSSTGQGLVADGHCLSLCPDTGLDRTINLVYPPDSQSVGEKYTHPSRVQAKTEDGESASVRGRPPSSETTRSRPVALANATSSPSGESASGSCV